MKAASVRALRRTSVPVLAAGAAQPAIRPHRILAGILAPNAVGNDLSRALPSVLARLAPDESLIFLIIRLLERLRAMGAAPDADLMAYARTLQSFRATPIPASA